MLIAHNDIERAFKKVKAIRDHMQLYHVDGASHRLSVDTLTKTIADMYDLTIERYQVASAGKHVAGMVERYADGRAIILVRAGLSDSMKRFVAVKELSHLMLDEQDDWSSVGVATLKEMKIEFDMACENGQGVSNPSRTQTSEYLAWMAAISLMYPCEFHAADMIKIDQNETSVAKLALYHDMPAHALEDAFTHREVFSQYEAANG